MAAETGWRGILNLSGLLGQVLTVVAVAAGIVGLAIAVGRWWVVLVGVGVIALLVLLVFALRAATRAADRVRRYPDLVKRIADQALEIDDLRRRLDQVEADGAQRWGTGLEEGIDRLVGAILSRRALELPSVQSISMGQDGAVCLVGVVSDAESVEAGTRFTLVVQGSGEVKGHVRVEEMVSEENQNFVIMKCVERTVDAYWAHLEERAASDSAPPGGVRLERYAGPATVNMDVLLTPTYEEPAPDEGASGEGIN